MHNCKRISASCAREERRRSCYIGLEVLERREYLRTFYVINGTQCLREARDGSPGLSHMFGHGSRDLPYLGADDAVGIAPGGASIDPSVDFVLKPSDRLRPKRNLARKFPVSHFLVDGAVLKTRLGFDNGQANDPLHGLNLQTYARTDLRGVSWNVADFALLVTVFLCRDFTNLAAGSDPGRPAGGRAL